MMEPDPVPPPLSSVPVATSGEDQLTDRDASHLQVLAAFHYVLGGFAFLFGGFSVVYIALGVVMMTNPEFLQQMAPPHIDSYPTHEEMQEDVLFGGEAPPMPVPVEAVPGPEPVIVTENEDLKLAASLMIGVGAISLLLTWISAGLLMVAGRSLQKRKRRVFCMVVAGLSCLNIPIGTTLGIFTLIVLQRPTVAAAFQRN